MAEVTKYEVLEYFEERKSACADWIASEFGLSDKAAYRHVQRLNREGLIVSDDGGAGMWAHRRFRITRRGRERLDWYREEVAEPDDEIAFE